MPIGRAEHSYFLLHFSCHHHCCNTAPPIHSLETWQISPLHPISYNPFSCPPLPIPLGWARQHSRDAVGLWAGTALQLECSGPQAQGGHGSSFRTSPICRVIPAPGMVWYKVMQHFWERTLLSGLVAIELQSGAHRGFWKPGIKCRAG